MLNQRVLRIGQNLLQRSFVEIFQRRDNRQAADEFRDKPVFQQILRLDVTEDFAGTAVFRRQNLGCETDRGRTSARGDDLLEARKGTATDEEDIGRINLQELLLRMLAAACGGTEATVPSMIFSNACCTPSPDTSRVIDGLSDLRLILSISSI